MTFRCGFALTIGAGLLLCFPAFPLAQREAQNNQRECASKQLIIWNVGQGQWVTFRDELACWHFDLGGEQAPWRQLSETCRGRLNIAHFSHWDWDHVSFAQKAARQLPRFCVRKPPLGEASEKRRRILHGLPECTIDLETSFIREIHSPPDNKPKGRKPQPNAMSRVFLLSRRLLVPGDSTSAQEKEWSKSIASHRVSTLVLGHHGSKTSTSKELLKKAPRLRLAIASARRAKYGHPHANVVSRLKAQGVAVVSTDSWGSIYLDLDLDLDKKAPCADTNEGGTSDL